MKKQYVTATDLAATLGISKSNAYLKIAEMNEELRKNNYIVIAGKVPLAYVRDKFYGVDFGEDANANN